MTDTARTLAAIKALLADNTSGDISPQDMRDLVESIVNPVAGGGFPYVAPTQDEAFSFYAVNQAISVPSGFPVTYLSPNVDDYTGYDPDPDVSGVYVHDPMGLATTTSDPTSDYSAAVGGMYLTGIPRGTVWCMRAVMRWDAGTFVAADKMGLTGGNLNPDYPPPDNWLDDTAGGIWGAPIYAYMAHDVTTYGALHTYGFQYGTPYTIVAYDDPLVGSWEWTPPAVYQHSGETQTLNTVSFDLWRVA